MTKPHPDVTLARFAARNHGLFTRSDALLAGLSNAAIGRRLRSGEWVRVYKNVYCMASAPRTWHLRVLALCLRRPGAVWASGRTAGLLWQLDGCDHEVVEVVSTENIRGREEVVVHRVRDMPRHHTTFIGRIPVTTVHRTLADLGSVADPDIVELALECALRRGLTNPDRLQRVISDLGTAGRRGTAALAAILRAHEGRPTESSLETMFVQFLRRNGISAPTRQHAVTDHNGFLAHRFLLGRPHGGGRGRQSLTSPSKGAVGKGPSASQRSDGAFISCAACHSQTTDDGSGRSWVGNQESAKGHEVSGFIPSVSLSAL